MFDNSALCFSGTKDVSLRNKYFDFCSQNNHYQEFRQSSDFKKRTGSGSSFGFACNVCNVLETSSPPSAILNNPHYEQAVNVKLLYEVMIKIPRTKVNNVISSGFLKIINRRRCEMFNIIESLDEEIIWYIYKYDSMT